MRRTDPERARPRSGSRGFTLVEMVVSITLLGILSVVASPMLRLPMQAWMDAQRRAEATQALELIQGKLAADLTQAMPGSVRVQQVGGRWLLEYMEVRAQGRHRAADAVGPQSCPVCSVAARRDALEAGCPERCFTALGALQGAAPVAAVDWVVVHPQGPGVPDGDPWRGGVVTVPGSIKSRLLGVAASPEGPRLTIAPLSFPQVAPSRRFYVVSQAVSWACNPATGQVTRHWGYAFSQLQPAAFGAAPNAVVAENVRACRFALQPSGAEGRGSVTLWLRQARVDGSNGIAENLDLAATVAVGMP